MKISSLTYPIRKIYYRLRLFKRLWKSYFAPWGICDSILEFNMEVFCEFYKYGDMESIDYEWDESWKLVKSQMDEIYNWWTIEREKRLEEIETVLDEWSQHSIHYWKKIEDGKLHQLIILSTKYSRYLFELQNTLEFALEKETEKYLVWLVEMRNYLWT